MNQNSIPKYHQNRQINFFKVKKRDSQERKGERKRGKGGRRETGEWKREERVREIEEEVLLAGLNLGQQTLSLKQKLVRIIEEAINRLKKQRRGSR